MDGSTMNNNKFSQSNLGHSDGTAPAASTDQPSTNQQGFAVKQAGNESSATASTGQGDMAGYPLLLQQFFLQQQAEAAQQQLQYGNAAHLGLFANQMGLNPQWNNYGSSNGDFSTAGRNSMLMQGGAAANAAFMGMQQHQLQSQQQAQQTDQDNTNNDMYAKQGLLGPWSSRSAGLLGKMVCTNPAGAPNNGKVKRTRRKQPKDKPKRPLSAYNIFFKEERARLLEQKPAEGDDQDQRTANGKIGFESLAKRIGSKWQSLGATEVQHYKDKAAEDMERYRKAMEEYNQKRKSGEGDDPMEKMKRQKTAS